MYKIPKDFDLTVMVGQPVRQLSYAYNNVVISFPNGYIQIDGAFKLQTGKEVLEDREVYPVTDDMNLLMLLELSVIKIEYDNETLHIYFERDIRISLLNNKMYESYSLNFDGRKIII